MCSTTRRRAGRPGLRSGSVPGPSPSREPSEMSGKLRVAGAALIVLLWSGCLRLVDFHAHCSQDGDCDSDQICVDSVCRAPCASDDECGSSFRCRAGRCESFCTSDLQCSLGLICNGGDCVTGCRRTAGCPPDMACIDSTCQSAQRCMVTADCSY